MTPRVVLHIGAPKSGTTYLQSVIWGSRKRLERHGVLVPGRRRFDHTKAAGAVCSERPAKVRPGTRYALWEGFARQAREGQGTTLISDEWFVSATAEQARRAVEDLAGCEVHVVFTARDFTRQVPAAWQEELKLGNASSLEEFVAGLDAPGTKWSWDTLDAAEVLPRWAGTLPADRVHVVTVPPGRAEPDLLWRRFAAASGFDPAWGDTDVTDANESLGVEAARFLQEVGPALREAVDADHAHWTEQYKWLRRYVGHEVLVPLGGGRIGLDEATTQRLRERTARTQQVLRESGWDLQGDLDDLSAATPQGRSPSSVTAEEMLAVAVRAMPKILGRLREEAARADRLAEQGGGSGMPAGEGGARRTVGALARRLRGDR